MDLWFKISMTLLIVAFFSLVYVKMSDQPKSEILGWIMLSPLLAAPMSCAEFLLVKIWI